MLSNKEIKKNTGQQILPEAKLAPKHKCKSLPKIYHKYMEGCLLDFIGTSPKKIIIVC